MNLFSAFLPLNPEPIQQHDMIGLQTLTTVNQEEFLIVGGKEDSCRAQSLLEKIIKINLACQYV